MLKRVLYIAALVALMLAPEAQAQILWAGSEDLDWTYIGGSSCARAGNGFAYSGSFVRDACGFGNGTSTSDPPSDRMQTPTFTATSNSLWIHANLFDNLFTSTNNEQAMLVRSPDGVSRILVRQTGTAGILKVSTRNAAGTITDLATASSGYSTNTTTAFDLQINYTCSGSGGVAMWIGGTQVINYTGNPCTDSATSLNQVEVMSTNNSSNQGTCGPNNNQTCWSEFIVAQQNTVGMRLWALTPQATGNTQSWTGSVGNINENPINDSNNINTATNNALSEWTTPTSYPAGTWSLLAVVQAFRVLASASGPQHFQPLMRVNSTDNTSGANITPTSSYGNYKYIWATNPHTGLAFATSDIASGFNLGLESEP